MKQILIYTFLKLKKLFKPLSNKERAFIAFIKPSRYVTVFNGGFRRQLDTKTGLYTNLTFKYLFRKPIKISDKDAYERYIKPFGKL